MSSLKTRLAVSVVLVAFITMGILATTSASSGDNLAAQVRALTEAVGALHAKTAKLEKRIEELEHHDHALTTKLACVSSLTTDTDFIFEGCNVHVRNGEGGTRTTNGYGNLIVGYNKNEVSTRTGSHNIVVGDLHEYTSYGGIVTGTENTLTAPESTILGGVDSHAQFSGATIISADRGTADTVAVIVGGRQNYAAPGGNFGALIGGNGNTLSGLGAVVVGGDFDVVSGPRAVAVGGGENHVSGGASCVCGGTSNDGSGPFSSVSGGENNIASGQQSSVSGGFSNTAAGDFSSILGGNGVTVNTTYGTSP